MSWREGLVAALLALAATLAQAVSPCMLVFGQGRNPPQQGAPDWDELNRRFNAAVAETLDAAGRRVYPMTVSSVHIDPEGAGHALLQEAERLRCLTLAETAVFVDEQDTLVLRLRIYPLLPTVGDSGGITGLRIGAPLFVTQRDLDRRALARMKLALIGQQMAEEYLQRDRR